MYRYLTFCLLMSAGLTVNAQTVNLRGKVTSQAGKPVADAVVSLVGQELKDTTGTDGAYEIVKNDVSVLPLLSPQSKVISMEKGFLVFSLPDPSTVKVEIFNVKGNLLKKELLRNARAGFYRFNIAENSFSTKILLIRASIGRKVTMFRYLRLKNSNYMVNSSVESSIPVGGGLAKITAVSDTMKVTAAGYAKKAIAITSYDQELDVTLFNEGAVVVQLDQTRQKIDGFGINNNWQPAFSDQQADDLFDPDKGLGLNILRIGMNENGSFYNSGCQQDISKAKSRGCQYIIGTLWSPPGNYKTNGSVNDGGHLKPGNYEQWATKIADFAGSNKLYGMSPQNETDFASCGTQEPCNGSYPTTLFTGKEYLAFFKVVAPKIRAKGVKVIAPEASEWLHAWSDFSACCSEPGGKGSSDPFGCGFLGKDDKPLCDHEEGYDYGHWLASDKAAWDMVDIFGTHQYDTQVAEPWPDDVPRENAQGVIPVWQTEMSGVKWWPEQGPSTDIKNGVAVAGWIHNALTVGEASGWCWWWYKAMGATNEGLYNSDGSDTKRHYTFGNYSKYVRPGMVRVEVAGSFSKDVLLSAYKGEGSKVVVVAINKGSGSASVPINISGGTAPSSMTPYVTSANENWGKKSAITVSGGSFTAELGGTTVTTFVGE
ncbi:MAG: hypothetical protein JW913_12770 [Chitinispirillaceae bacterium]|nr:hypothetical protein [Chitinispirillaceae bacterium]